MVEMLSLNYRRRPPPPDPPVVEGINLRELYIEYAGVRTGNQHGSKRMEKISRCRSRGAVTLVEVFCVMTQMICFTELILPSLLIMRQAMSQCISDSECEGFLFGIIENCPPCTDDKRFFFKAIIRHFATQSPARYTVTLRHKNIFVCLFVCLFSFYFLF